MNTGWVTRVILLIQSTPLPCNKCKVYNNQEGKAVVTTQPKSCCKLVQSRILTSLLALFLQDRRGLVVTRNFSISLWTTLYMVQDTVKTYCVMLILERLPRVKGSGLSSSSVPCVQGSPREGDLENSPDVRERSLLIVI